MLALRRLDKERIHTALMKIGRCSGCHQIPERSFFWKGYQFPICARCTGVVIGQAVGMLTYFIYKMPWKHSSFFLFLMFLDWFLQRMKILQSNNIRRLITGLLCGYALGQCYITVLLSTVLFITNHLGGIS